MENILKTRYMYINNIVNELYLKHRINKYPINLENIYTDYSNELIIVSLSQFAKFNNLTDIQISYFIKDDGFCSYHNSLKKYIICWNDYKESVDGRILWTISHELAHFFLGHCTLTFDGIPEEEVYYFKEREANYFTSIFLAHPAVLDKIIFRNSKELEVFCGLSESAALHRYKNFINNKCTGFRKGDCLSICNNFNDYINEKIDDYQSFQYFANAFQLQKGW